jgi:hypothetical protein
MSFLVRKFNGPTRDSMHRVPRHVLHKLIRFFDPIGKLGFLTETFNGPTRESMRHVLRVKIRILN